MADSEYSQYYNAFSTRLLSGEGISPDECACGGCGWILSQVDTWHKCPDHWKPEFKHPDDDSGCYDVTEDAMVDIVNAEGIQQPEPTEDDIPF